MGSRHSIIAIDLMGSDKGPAELMEGVKLALAQKEKLPHLMLVGRSILLEKLVKKVGLQKYEGLYSICNASEVVKMDEKPLQAIRSKRESSMVKGLEMVKNGECSAFLSCGNTGALMAGAVLKVRLADGIERPALSSVIPSKGHEFILLDVGANPETTGMQLVHNAILGANHCKVALGIESPKVGLLTIGTEEGKGTERIHQAHEYLKSINGVINYMGLIEGFQVFNDVDVVVCDGFVGNILVKTCESMLHMLKDLFVDEVKKNLVRTVGAGLTMGALKAIKQKFNPDLHSSAPLLGLRGLVVKSHGSSNRYAIKQGINATARMVKKEMNSKILDDVAKANNIIAELLKK